jgi:GNAT superfamily N-acetyltransferase
MDSDFFIRMAEVSDVGQLGVIGPAIYAEAYSQMWGDPEAYAKQLTSFGHEEMWRFMTRSDTAVWVVEFKTQIVGFLTLVLGSPDPIDGRTDGVEVPRIYLLAPVQGRGFAKAMLMEAEKFAKSRGANHIWLDAMLAAPWAWQTYKKWGFSEIGRKAFSKGIKAEFEEMVVLRREFC